MSYYDCYLVPIKKADKEKYLNHVKLAWEIFKEYGAISITEFWGDDVADGTANSFALSLKLQEDETALIGYIEWESKDIRNKNLEKVMSDERMHKIPMPFDGGRILYGGFDKIVEI